MLGEVVTIKAVAAETAGAYALFEARTPPRQGTPPHLRRYDDAAFFVLEGTYALEIGGRSIALGPGGYAFVPRGTVHAYANVGAGPARLLLLVSPGGIHEEFVADVVEAVPDPVAAPAPAGRQALAKILAAAAKYGVEFVSQTAG
jgi:quercetin dioxygenase-like cupin family protein